MTGKDELQDERLCSAWALYSRWALGLALLMPVIAIFIGNCWGYSKMDTSQYDGLIQRIDSVCQKIEKQDVVPCLEL